MSYKFILLLTFSFSLLFNFVNAKTKKDIKHNFKITGSKKLNYSTSTRSVAYDPTSPDHLIISTVSSNGDTLSKRTFLFTGAKYSLKNNLRMYMDKDEMVLDGSEHFYKRGIRYKTFHKKRNSIYAESNYYPDGTIKSYVPGPGEQYLNGEYKLWYNNGQLGYTGVYKDYLKNGEFCLYDKDGILLKKGIYENSMLISGDTVLRWTSYEYPDVPATFSNQGLTLDEYLTQRAKTKVIPEYFWEGRSFHYALTFKKDGELQWVYCHANINQREQNAIFSLFIKLPGMSPAYHEGAPVKSCQHVSVNFKDHKVWLTPYDRNILPPGKFEPAVFPGGADALRNFINKEVIYPVLAAESNIQGRVIVNYVVKVDGSIGRVEVIRGVHPLLDEEAIRVVRSIPKYKPATVDGVCVPFRYTMPIDFKLSASSGNH